MTVKRSTVRAVSATTALAVSSVLAACGPRAPSKPADAAPAGKIGVAISNYSYHPPTITVARGATVTFTNHDQTAHTATASGSTFDTGTLKPGQRSTIHLNKPGRYIYYCQFHAFMHGTIIVK